MAARTLYSQTKTLTILSGATASGSMKIGEFSSGSVQLPAAMTGTALTIQTSNDNSTWASVRDVAGAAKAAITVAASITVPLHPETFNALYMRLVSGSAEAADRTLLLGLKG